MGPNHALWHQALEVALSPNHALWHQALEVALGPNHALQAEKFQSSGPGAPVRPRPCLVVCARLGHM